MVEGTAEGQDAESVERTVFPKMREEREREEQGERCPWRASSIFGVGGYSWVIGQSAFSVRKDEGMVHAEAYSSSSFGHSHERGSRTASETLSEHGNDDWRLGTDGDGTHLIDFRVVY
jgi:hypothetical protein